MLYLWGLVRSPAVLVAVKAGKQDVFIRVNLAKAQRLVGVITDHIVTIDQLLSLWAPILKENMKVRG